jgi:hypothetical protein
MWSVDHLDGGRGRRQDDICSGPERRQERESPGAEREIQSPRQRDSTKLTGLDWTGLDWTGLGGVDGRRGLGDH